MTTESNRRKLTTILAADVVSYSQMMAVNEVATLERLKSYRVVTDKLVKQHNGRIFSTAGDAFLAEFDSAVEAVRCGISIQEDLRVRNTQLPEDKQMWFRIGINVGDVIIENGDLFGDGVNIAARLEGLAEKGGICISGSTFEQVKNKLSIGFDDIGKQKVKNIPDPISAFRLVPGKIDVRDEKELSNTNRIIRSVRSRPYRVWALVLVTLLLTASVIYVNRYGVIDSISKNPVDGRWQVSLNSLSGCLNNNSRSYFINVLNGEINEQHHPLPKTGTISADGRFIIEVTDAAGNLQATQTGRIIGSIGDGQLQGRKPECIGKIALKRIK